MSNLDQQIADAVADGKITEDDADAVREFGEFLTEFGSHDDNSPEARQRQRAALIKHAEFCGLKPEDVERLKAAQAKEEQ